MDGIYWETFYNGDKIPDDQTGYIFFENKLLGVPRIRQVKVRNDSCVVHRDFADDIKEFGLKSGWSLDFIIHSGEGNPWILQGQG